MTMASTTLEIMSNISITIDGLSTPVTKKNCSYILQHFTETYPVNQWKADGFFEDNDLLDIDCHWMAFKPVKASVHFLMTFLYIVVFLVGFFSNTLTVYIIASSKKLHTPAHILLANVAISDLLAVIMIPISIFNSFYQGPAIGQMGCSIYGFLTSLSGTCTLMSLTAVAVERYLVIGRPLNVGGKPTRCWAYIMSLSAWLYSAIFASLPLFGFGKYVPEGFLTDCSVDYLSNDLTTKIFILTSFVGSWVVPLTITTSSYVSIIQTISRVRSDVTQIAKCVPPPIYKDINSKPTGTIKFINQLNVDLKVSKNLMGFIGAWALTWTPHAVVALMGIFGYGHLLTPTSVVLPSLLTKLATCVDPFVYALNQPKIRKELSNRLHRLSTVLHSSGAVFNYPDRASPYFHQSDQISPSALLDCSSRQQHLMVWGRSNVRTDYTIRERLRYQYRYHSRRPADIKGNVIHDDGGTVNRTEPRHSFVIPQITFSESKNIYSGGNIPEIHTMSTSKRTASQTKERMNVDAEVVHVIDNYNNENGKRNDPNIFTVISSAALMMPNSGDSNDSIRRVPETLI